MTWLHWLAIGFVVLPILAFLTVLIWSVLKLT